MRRLPKELRRALGREVKDTVAEPLAADIRSAWRGPHAHVLSAATKARVSTDPQIVIGGSRRVVSGGASPRDLVFGNEWGGGKRIALVNRRRTAGRGRVSAAERASAGRRIHRRHTTRQFPRQGQHAVYGTIHATLDRSFERWVTAVNQIIDKVVLTNGR